MILKTLDDYTNYTDFPETDIHGVLKGPAGLLEVLVQLTKDEDNKSVAVICHPNPTQGGTMHNKVVYTLGKAFLAKGINVIRFNYRGVGQSQGEFDQAIGEVADLNAVITWLKKVWGKNITLYLAGFSFGTYISAAWAIENDWPIKQLFSIAPPVDRLNFDKLILEHPLPLAIRNSWVIFQGEQDEVVPSEAVYQWIEGLPQYVSPYVTLEKFAETGHFFHGKLLLLKDAVMQYILTK